MKKVLFTLLFIPFFANAQNVIWADYLETDSTLLINGKEVLGKPNTLNHYKPNLETSCTFKVHPLNATFMQTIKVSFNQPSISKQIVIAQNYNYGAISNVFVYDSLGKSKEVYKNVPSGLISSAYSEFLMVNSPKNFKIKSIEVVLNLNFLEKKECQIDAIGLVINEKLKDLEYANYFRILTTLNPDFYPKQFNNSTNSNSIPNTNKEGIIPKKVKIAQTPKIEKINLGKNINSRGREVAPIISFDENTLIFTREGHEDNIGKQKKQDVWIAKRENGKWTKPQNIGVPINTDADNAVTTISVSGNTLFVLNQYLPNNTYLPGLSKSKKVKNGWSFPEKMEIENYKNFSKFTEFAIAPNGKNLILAAKRITNRGKDLYVSFLKNDSTWSMPIYMSDIINSQSDEVAPFIASDSRTLYYSSRGFEGFGDSDIYMSVRLDDTWTNWSEPINLGREINTIRWDGYFNVSINGEIAYTCSETNSIGAEDIFEIKLPKELQPKPVAYVKGINNDKSVVKGINNDKSVKKIEVIEISNPNEKYLADFDSETGEYVLVLPVGVDYRIEIDGKLNHKKIELSKYDKFERLEINF